MSSKITHVGFADESHWNEGRFRSLGLVTTSCDSLYSFDKELRALLDESKVGEFKWKNLEGAKERFAAQKLCKFTIDKACAGQLRVDVLIWDISDSRHNIRGRDDISNLERMYYHLFRNVMRARWPNDATWRLHPDEHTALNWETVRDCLEVKSTRLEIENSLFSGGKFRLRLHREFGIEEICPVSSEKHPLIQVADHFAGLAVFSHKKFDEYQEWLNATSGQSRLFEDDDAFNKLSRSSQERFKVLKAFDVTCKQKKLGVSLRSSKGLRTLRPENPINFWMYEPQHSDDKAPTKENQRV